MFLKLMKICIIIIQICKLWNMQYVLYICKYGNCFKYHVSCSQKEKSLKVFKWHEGDWEKGKKVQKKTTLKEQFPQKIPDMLSSAHSHTKQKIRYFREHCSPNNIRPHWLLLHGKTYLLLCNTGKKPVQICNDIERKCIDVCTCNHATPSKIFPAKAIKLRSFQYYFPAETSSLLHFTLQWTQCIFYDTHCFTQSSVGHFRWWFKVRTAGCRL